MSNRAFSSFAGRLGWSGRSVILCVNCVILWSEKDMVSSFLSVPPARVPWTARAGARGAEPPRLVFHAGKVSNRYNSPKNGKRKGKYMPLRFFPFLLF